MNNRTTNTGDKSNKGNSGTAKAIPIHTSKLRQARSEKANKAVQADYNLKELAEMTARIAQLPEIDAARIVELHDRIMKGEYQIDSNNLASKLQNFESDL